MDSQKHEPRPMPARRWRAGWLIAGLCGLLAAWPAQAQRLDLGASADAVRTHLGPADKVWANAVCPDHRIELRRSGALWLKLAFTPDGKLGAAGIFRLARPARGKGVVLRWPGLKPGFGPARAYPPAAGWNPALMNIGAKQWQWLEQAQASPVGREQLLGSVVVDDASGFASGRDFPFVIAQAATEAGLSGAELQEGESNRPLLAWRRRTRPNAFVEALAKTGAHTDCSPASMAILDYTDILPSR